MAQKKGQRVGGRTKGTPNKVSATAKENIIAVFERLGGTAAMARWAKRNPNDFYRIYAKLLPIQLTGEGGGAVPIDMKIVFVAPKAEQK